MDLARQQLMVAESLPAYDVLRLWASRNHSQVYEAQERAGTRRPVLVRVSNSPVEAEDRRRFASDVAAATARGIQGDAVRLYGSGFLPTGQAYLVTAYWPSSLDQEINSFGRVTPARAVRIGLEIAFKLGGLHRSGVVLGGMSSRQVLTAAGAATLDVFGVEAMTDPQVVGGRASSPAGDVYTLAATLYEALSGRRPSVREPDQPPPDPPGVPEALMAILRRAMNVDPGRRQAGMDELIDDLKRYGNATRIPFEVRLRDEAVLAVPAYDIGRLVETDAFCHVYEGRARDGGQAVAVTVSNYVMTTPERRRRFGVEIAAAVGRSAAGDTARLYTSGLLPDRHPYLVTECLPTLAAHLDEHGPLRPAGAVALGVRVGRILAAAHRTGTVHRHVMPQTVLMRADGTPVLGVFGVHTMVTSEDPGEVVYGPMRWLFAYASPEAITGVWTAAGDMYSLAATMYGALCGRPPYWPADQDVGPFDVYRRMEREPVAQPPGVPDELFAVLRRAMSFTPADRHAGMDEFADDLARCAN